MSSERNAQTMGEMWYVADISSVKSTEEDTLELELVIPRDAPERDSKLVGELYVLGQRPDGSQSLLGICQVISKRPLYKEFGSELKFKVGLVMKDQALVDKLRITYNYDIEKSTTSALDVLNLLEAGNNVQLSIERTQVRIDILSPWPVNKDENGYDTDWIDQGDPVTVLLAAGEKARIVADGAVSMFGGGGSIRLASKIGANYTTLDRRDYDGAISNESFKFDRELQGSADSQTTVTFQMQSLAPTNVRVDLRTTISKMTVR